MRFRQRSDDTPHHPHSGEEADEGSLLEVRRSANDLLHAGDDAINRALSGDSELFLRANRQDGGQ